MRRMIEYLAQYAQLIIAFGGITALIGAYLSSVKSELDSVESQKVINSLSERASGGESLCLVDILIYGNDKSKTPHFSVFMHGIIPLKNVVIKIDDYAKRVLEIEESGIIDPSSMKIQEIIKKNEYVFNYPAVYPSSTYRDIEIPVKTNQKNLRYLVTIESDNGKTEEVIEVTNYKDLDRKYSIKVERNGKLLIDSNTPIQLREQIDSPIPI
jgi:hypothetical protein